MLWNRCYTSAGYRSNSANYSHVRILKINFSDKKYLHLVFGWCRLRYSFVETVQQKKIFNRKIQPLATIRNDVQQRILVPAVIGGCVLELCIALASMVNVPATVENVPILIAMEIGCVDSLLALICGLHGFAEVHEKLRGIRHAFKLDMSTMKNRKRRKWTQQFIKSCGVIKLKSVSQVEVWRKQFC